MANEGPVDMSQRPRVRLLGQFEVHAGGRAVHLPGKHQRLVAYLALSNRPCPRAKVAGVLWPEGRDARSMANLRSALWRLRQPELTLVAATPADVRLAPDVIVDVHDLGSATAGPGDAVLPSGDLLPGWDDEWVVTERERLRQLRLHAWDARGRQLLGAGRTEDALELARLAVATAPDRESAQRVLIAAYVAHGERRKALRQYRAYCSRLADAYGGEPSPAMTDLVAPLAMAGDGGV
jgi:DNA-binding SARP family transcriptional activator